MRDLMGLMKQAQQLQQKMQAITGGLPLPPGFNLGG